MKNMKQKQNTNKNKDDLKFETVVNDCVIFDIMQRKKPI